MFEYIIFVWVCLTLKYASSLFKSWSKAHWWGRKEVSHRKEVNQYKVYYQESYHVNNWVLEQCHSNYDSRTNIDSWTLSGPWQDNYRNRGYNFKRRSLPFLFLFSLLLFNFTFLLVFVCVWVYVFYDSISPCCIGNNKNK